jgi:uncharacterized membrane protein YccC
VAATGVSFIICLIYLIFLPFHLWSLAVLIAVSAFVVILIGRPGDGITAGITTAVVLSVAAVSPHDAWQQPILRFADTVVGTAVGVAAAWLGLYVIHPALAKAPGGRQPASRVEPSPRPARPAAPSPPPGRPTARG